MYVCVYVLYVLCGLDGLDWRYVCMYVCMYGLDWIGCMYVCM